ncbi:MAG: S9 family peptidase [Alistipes sp.]|nr:S9 family peptidase [Alistipes sp.]
MGLRFIAAALLMWVVQGVYGQHMFDYSDFRAGRFTPQNVHGIRSMADGEHYTVLEGNSIVKYSYKTGEMVSVVIDFDEFLDVSVENYTFSADERRLLVATGSQPIYRHSFTAIYHLFDIAGRTGIPITDYPVRDAAFLTPDGRRIGFIHENDLYYCEVTTGTDEVETVRITHDGEYNRIINGHTDWVYEEEFGFTKAYDVSPDGRYIAYLRFNETEVPEFSISRYTGSLYPEPLTFKYPKAGEKNSVVTLHVTDLADGSTTRVDTGPETDQYIPHIGWDPEGRLYFYRLNRLQNRLELLLCRDGFNPEVIHTESDRRYIERPDETTVTFLPRDRFIIQSERSGYRHLYLHTIDKGVTDTLTRGNWEVLDLISVTGDRVYYLSNEGSSIRNNLYSVKLNGKGKNKLTDENGVWSIAPSEGFRYFISRFSNVSTPLQVRLHDARGKVLRTLEDNSQLAETLQNRRVPRKEFFRITTERGTALNCYVIKPLDFDPAKKYPVMMTQYSGPGSQSVQDRWSMDWTDVLVQEGYLVMCVDGRGTGGRGADFRKVTYRNLGGPEVEDQISAAKYMATQPYVDPDRIGIYGWSYGGFMALNCILKGNDIFKMAIAVAPVTSWRYYDTIYTEIYNGLPEDNPHGYDNNSPVNFADRLKGRLLIVHGTEDDNVHFQNAMAMADALIRAGKDFDMMICPDDNHGMYPTGRHHVREKMIRYTLDNL